MDQPSLKRIIILGGGTAGWMAAAAFAKLLHQRYEIRLVESDEISTIGVGEATIPAIKQYNASLGIDENEFMRATQASFKLGIEFVDWSAIGSRYIHTFAAVGQDLGLVPFHHYWFSQFQRGRAEPLGAYSVDTVAAWNNKFQRPVNERNSPLSAIAYAFHFDAGLYARFLRGFAEARGVRRTEGKVLRVEQHARGDRFDGWVSALVMADGERIEGDLFIDCSGFAGLLIEKTLHTGFDDWSDWLPCDSAWAVPCARAGELTPYTRSTAQAAGWQWRIPLQHRTGNGHVFCSRFMDTDEALKIVLAGLDGPVLAEPRLLRFTTGRRRKFWNCNVVALGLASGFMEPLESTSIHLVQTGIARLMNFFPGADWAEADRDEFNRQSAREFELVRDFLVLHYRATQRADSPFWRHCQNLPEPESLTARLALYRGNGRLQRVPDDIFAESSWLQVLVGQGILPGGAHALAHLLDDSDCQEFLNAIRSGIAAAVQTMPRHQDFIAAHCAAPALATGI